MKAIIASVPEDDSELNYEHVITEAEKIAGTVADGIEKKDFSDINHQLKARKENAVQHERCVFEHPSFVPNIVLIMLCALLCGGLLISLVISLGITLYSNSHLAYGIVGLIGSLTLIGINIVAVVKSSKHVKFCMRYDTYLPVLRIRKIELIDDLVAFSNIPSKIITKDLAKAVELKWIPQGHFSKDVVAFFTTNSVFSEYKNKQAAYDRCFKDLLEERMRTKGYTAEMKAIMEQGKEHVTKIHDYNDIIKDKAISQKLDRMEKIVSMIFHEVDMDPRQSKKLRRFLHYYLPTTEKLLEAYINADDGDIKGKYLTDMKKEIVQSLDMINDAFEELLNQFFRKQELDIASEIAAFDTVLQQEGLK